VDQIIHVQIVNHRVANQIKKRIDLRHSAGNLGNEQINVSCVENAVTVEIAPDDKVSAVDEISQDLSVENGD